MSKFCALLISLIISTSCYSKEVQGFEVPEEGLETYVSGFIYNQHFSDSKWQDDKTIAAINLDLEYSNFGLSYQGYSLSNEPRRLFVSYKRLLGSGTEFEYDYGRFNRINGFYNNVTDNPGTAGMAMLPFAGYNQRMQHSSFTTMTNAHQVSFKHKTISDDLVTFKLAQGDLYVDNQDDLQKEVYGKVIQGAELYQKYPTKEVAFHFESYKWHFYYSYSQFFANSKITELNPYSNYVVNKINQATYNLEKYGVKYSTINYFIQTEYILGDTTAFDSTNRISFNQKAYDIYGVYGYYFNEKNYVYLGHSNGHTNNGKSAYDSFIGYTRENGDYAFSTEYHQGIGKPYIKYESCLDDYSTWVTSFTYRFK